MEQIMAVFSWLYVNYGALILAVEAVLSALIVLFLIVPGDQPEKALQAAVDFVKKLSRK